MNNQDAGKSNRNHYIKLFLIFFLLFALLTKPTVSSWNDQSRMAQIQSIVEHQTLIIDQSMFSSTGDKYFFNNHFYSDKPPLLAIYASPIYFILKSVGLSFEQNTRWVCYLIVLFSMGSLSALSLTIFRKILKDFSPASDQWADVVTIVAGSATMILPYSLVFNNHIASGALLILGLYYILYSRKTDKPRYAMYSGLFVSLAGSIDINCFLFIPFALILLSRTSIRSGLIFTLSCISIVSLYLFLNLQTSGSLMPPAVNEPLWNYPGAAFSKENLSGLAKHKNVGAVLFYAFHMLVGNRGLILHSPILLFSALGIFTAYRKNIKLQYKSIYIYLLLAVVLYIGIYLIWTTNYSGWAFGVRWFVSIILILCLPIVCLEHEIRTSKIMRSSFVAIACLSILISVIGSYAPFSMLNGTELQEQLSPTNTILANINSISDGFSTAISQSSIAAFVKIGRLLFTTVLIYGLFYESIKRLGPVSSGK